MRRQNRESPRRPSTISVLSIRDQTSPSKVGKDVGNESGSAAIGAKGRTEEFKRHLRKTSQLSNMLPNRLGDVCSYHAAASLESQQTDN